MQISPALAAARYALVCGLTMLGVAACQAPSETSRPFSEEDGVQPATRQPAAEIRELRAPTGAEGGSEAIDGGGGGAVPQASAPRPLSMLGSERTQGELLAVLEETPVRLFEPVGETEVRFRMVLKGDVHAVFQPRTRQHPRGHRSEVAAYRLARLLRMDNVPPAITRRVSARDLRSRLHPDFVDAWDEIARWTAWEEDGYVPGAAVYWVPGLRDLGLERPDRIRRLRRWLSQESPWPEEREPLVADVAAMVAFDYLIGNWARWDGGGVVGDASGHRLFVRGHQRAFTAPLPAALHRRAHDPLSWSKRFPRRFVERLARTGERELRVALEQDPGHAAGAPILSDAQVAGFMDRRAALLSYIGALIQTHGERKVLVFP